jgi:adenosylmethionine-8-amino-7-oxononanoate aminotransferase
MEQVERRGVFFYPFNHATGDGFVVAPPLNSTESDLDHLVTAVRDTLTEMHV